VHAYLVHAYLVHAYLVHAHRSVAHRSRHDGSPASVASALSRFKV